MSEESKRPLENVEAPTSGEGDPDAGNEEGERDVEPHSTTEGEEQRNS